MQNKIAGYINMHICPFPMIGGTELYISDLLIMNDFRGKGIGKALLLKAEEIAGTYKCVRIMLNNAKYAQSYIRSFYKKSGFFERDDFANFIKKISYNSV